MERRFERINQTKLANSNEYHIHKHQWIVHKGWRSALCSKPFPVPCANPNSGTRFDGNSGFSWDTVAQVSLSYKWPVTVRVSSGTTKGSRITCQHFISLYLTTLTFKIPSNKQNTHLSKCAHLGLNFYSVLWHHMNMLHVFPTLPRGAVWLITGGQYITIP